MSASVPNGLETQQGPVGGLPKVLGRRMELDTIYSMSGAVGVQDSGSWAGWRALQGATC